MVVASNLRRAIQTAVVGMKERLAQGQLEGDEGAKVVVVSHLQEVSRNVDTLSLAPKGEIPILPEIEENLPQDVRRVCWVAVLLLSCAEYPSLAWTHVWAWRECGFAVFTNGRMLLCL